MGKLKCLMIGNCQNTGIIHYLSLSDEFSKTYEIKQYTNWQLIRNNCDVPMMDIQNADLFIYQPLRIVHGCYSTDPSVEGSIGYYVKDTCVKIAYPYIFSSAVWPLVQKGKGINIWFGNEPIDKLILEGLKVDDILNLFYENKINWEYRDRFKKSIEILKGKETLTDIKISNFIEDNISNRLLFLIPQHPTSIIFLNVANQILEKLNMKKLSEDVIHSINDTGLPDSTYDDLFGMHPLHKSLIEDFDLKFGKEYLNNSEEFYAQRIINYLQLNGH
jgi:hypothetical protein